MPDMTATLPASPELTDEEDRRIAFALANFMSRHIVGEQFASTDETCRLCIDYALTVIAQVRGSERHRSSPSAELGDLHEFQKGVGAWMLACFGEAISADKIERNHRFIEEALELVQANGCTVSETHQLVDYVYGRPVGDPHQEVGGVAVTLAALCSASGLNMWRAAYDELGRIWTKVDAIRAKQAAKPKHSPLPEPPK